MSARKSAGEPYQAGEPRVQLLPPLVKQREKSRRTRRLLVFAVVVSIGVALAGAAYGYLRAFQAEAALAAEHGRTEQILTEQAKYAEAAKLATLVAASEEAQRQVTANEIDWLEVVTEAARHLPAGATFSKVAVHAPAPWEAALVPEGELRAARVAVLDLTIASPDYAMAAAFVRAIWNMDGVADVVITGSTNDVGAYLTTVTVTLDERVRSGRFLEQENEDDADDTAEPQPSETAAPGETPAPEETTEVEE